MRGLVVLAVSVLLLCWAQCSIARDGGATNITNASGVPCVIFTDTWRRYLKVEVLDEGLAHFEVSENRDSLPCSTRIYSTAMVDRTDYTFPLSQVNFTATSSSSFWTIATSRIRLQVSKEHLDVAVYDVSDPDDVWLMTSFGWLNLFGTDLKTMLMTTENTQHIYGLGEEFVNPHGSA